MIFNLSTVVPLLLITAMSAVIGLIIFLFAHDYHSQAVSLKFLSKIEQNLALQITLPQGIVQGTSGATASHGKIYFSFIGIPYALPPVGRLRFRDPVPAKKWESVLDGTDARPACIQVLPSFLSEYKDSEDCLYINVFTPLKNLKNINSTKLPVMVWFYGGGFLVGAPDFSYFGPDHFLEQEIIVVYFSYRLGPFGFLSTEDSESPGNYGLKDQQLALRWVKANIEYFGGDPNTITIFGQSAGAASVQYQLLYERNKGLFHAAISQSGSILSPWAFQKYPRKIAFDFGNAAGIRTTDSKALLKHLRSLPAERLRLASTRASIVNSIEIFHGIPFAPTIEKDEENAFLTKKPHELLEAGNFLNVSYMLGFNTMEIGVMEPVKFIASPFLRFYDFNLKLLLPSGVTSLEAANEIKNFYFNNNKTAAEKYIQYANDAYFNKPIIESARLIGEKNPTYMYLFSYEGHQGRAAMGKPPFDQYQGTFHGEEMAYLWYRSNLPKLSTTDRLVQKRMIKLWSNFAKTGNPTPKEEDLLQNTIWPVTTPNMTHLDINRDLIVRQNIKQDMMSFWSRIYSRYGEPPYDTY